MSRLVPTLTTVAALVMLAIPPAVSAQEERPEFERIAKSVEEIRGLEFKRNVQEVFLTREQLRRRLEQEAERELDDVGLRGEERVLVAFGMAQEGIDLRKVATDFGVGTIAGYYDPESKKLYLVDEDRKLDASSESLYAHELTHALQDQHFDLRKIGPSLEGHNDDEARAIVSLIEGDAQSVQYEHERVAGIAEEVEREFEKNRPEEALLERTPAIIVEDFNFPYDAGVGLVDTLFEEGGNEAVDAAFADPPQSTEQVIHPAKYLERDEPTQVRLPDLSGALGPGWSKLDEDTFGEFEIIVLLTGPKNTEQAFQAALPRAEGWDGDRYALYAQGDRELVVWHSVWDSPRDTREFAGALRKYDEGRFGSTYKERDGVLVLTDKDRAAIIERDGTHVRYILAPSRKLAEQVLNSGDRERDMPEGLPSTGGGGMPGARDG